MKHFCKISVLIFLMIPAIFFHIPPSIAGDASELQLIPENTSLITEINEDDNSITLNVRIPELSDGNIKRDALRSIPAEGTTSRDGYPILPAIGRWIKVQDHGKIELNYSFSDETILKDNPPPIYSEVENGTVEAAADFRHLWPAEPVSIGQPVIMRGVRLVPVTYYPVRWDPVRQEYHITGNCRIELDNLGGIGINEVEFMRRQPSLGFDRMIDALVSNPPRRDEPQAYPPGGYLVVADEEYPNVLDEFIKWKRKAGHDIRIITFDPENVDRIQLKVMIQEAYNEAYFEFLVFAGSEYGRAPLEIPYDDNFYDVFFAQLEGNDVFPDVAVGTFNCTREDNFTCAVRRAISYQYEPFIEETEWLTRAGVGVGACSVPDDLSPSYTGKWIAEVLDRRGFDDISTSFYADNQVDDPSLMIEDLYNEGVNFMLVRAHEWTFEPDNIGRSSVYPFHFLVSSGTISPNNNGAFNWAFRMGTGEEMKGPSAGFGHYGSPRTNIANALAGGLIQAMFFYDVGSYGWARNYAVANLWKVMPADEEDTRTHYYNSWRYYGDPSQWCWLGVPRELEVSYTDIIDPDATEISITVNDAENDTPFEGANVCVSQTNGFQVTGKTDANGIVNLTWGLDDLQPDEDMDVMVTGANLYPHSGVVDVQNADVFISVVGVRIDDEGGDQDGIANPGELIDIYVTLRNPRGVDSPALDAITLESLSSFARVLAEPQQAEGIPARQEIELRDGFNVTLMPDCPDGEALDFRVTINIADTEITGGFTVNVEAPLLMVQTIVGEDDFLPGAEANFRLELINYGHKALLEADATIESLSPFLVFPSNMSTFPIIIVDESERQDGDAFVARISPATIPGSVANFMVTVSEFMEQGISETLYGSVTIGEPEIEDPLGPDSYGYIALESGDNNTAWADAPQFNWLDINPNGGDVEGENLELGVVGENDSSVTVLLPFPLIYYGEEFNIITVCNNGWAAVGDQTNLKNQQNWPLPGFDGAFGMIAPFWDRLVMDVGNNGVFTWFDEDLGRFYIQWTTGILDIDREWRPNEFQLVLLNPDEYQTPTGDSQILFLYNEVNNASDQWEANAGATVGISSPGGMDGLTYTYWNNRSVACHPLQGARAILWTTINYAQPAIVRGQVTRFIDSTAVAGALVSTSNGFDTITDDEGNFRMAGVIPGTFDLTVAASRYGELVIEDVVLEESADIEINPVLPHGWLTVVPDTSLLRGNLIEANEGEIEIAVSNIGNADFQILEITSTCSLSLDNMELPLLLTPDDDSVAVRILIGGIGDPDSQKTSSDDDYYTLNLITDSPQEQIRKAFVIDWGVGVNEDPRGIPTEYQLSSAYPNPFNPETTIEFAVPDPSYVTISLFDIEGRKLRDLAKGAYNSGWHRVVLDSGKSMTAGVYLVRMESGDFKQTQRVVLLK